MPFIKKIDFNCRFVEGRNFPEQLGLNTLHTINLLCKFLVLVGQKSDFACQMLLGGLKE